MCYNMDCYKKKINVYSGSVLCDSGLIRFKYKNNICKVSIGRATFLNPICKKIKIPKIEGLIAKTALATEVSVGNNHLVLILNVTYNVALLLGKKLTLRNRFHDSVNVVFIKKIYSNKILLTVFEKGVGVTKSCGSGACAAIAALSSMNKFYLNKLMEVQFLHGRLKVIASLKGNKCNIVSPIMCIYGIANKVFEGSIKL